MNPEYEIARKAGFLPELEFLYQLNLECKYYIGILTVMAALVAAVGALFSIEDAPTCAAVIAVPNGLFFLVM